MYFSDFDTDSHVRYRMTLVHGINGEGMVSFSAILESGAVQDLGVAFMNLPDSCWAAASCSSSGDVTSLKVLYISGPEGKNPTTTCYYRPSVKFREGNVFTHVCLLTGGFHVTITMIHWTSLYRVPSPAPPPTSDMGTPCPPPASHIWYPLLETCSNLFI